MSSRRSLSFKGLPSYHMSRKMRLASPKPQPDCSELWLVWMLGAYFKSFVPSDKCTRISPNVQQVRGTKLALTSNNGPIVQQKLVACHMRTRCRLW
jgi:hypothetical protein